jgi:hypothetical protein
MKEEIGFVTGIATAEKLTKPPLELFHSTCTNETKIIQLFIKTTASLAMNSSF